MFDSIFKFDYIGETIKVIARVYLVIGLIVSLALGIACFAFTYISAETISVISIIISLLIFVVCSLCFWVSSCFIYGFGQLIENTD